MYPIVPIVSLLSDKIGPEPLHFLARLLAESFAVSNPALVVRDSQIVAQALGSVSAVCRIVEQELTTIYPENRGFRASQPSTNNGVTQKRPFCMIPVSDEEESGPNRVLINP